MKHPSRGNLDIAVEERRFQRRVTGREGRALAPVAPLGLKGRRVQGLITQPRKGRSPTTPEKAAKGEKPILRMHAEKARRVEMLIR